MCGGDAKRRCWPGELALKGDEVCSKFGLPILSLVITADIANNATVPGELLIETDAVHWLRSTRLVALSRFLISPDKRTDN